MQYNNENILDIYLTVQFYTCKVLAYKFCTLIVVLFLQKNKIYWWAWLNKKWKASKNTPKNCKAHTPSLLRILKPFFGR